MRLTNTENKFQPPKTRRKVMDRKVSGTNKTTTKHLGSAPMRGWLRIKNFSPLGPLEHKLRPPPPEVTETTAEVLEIYHREDTESYVLSNTFRGTTHHQTKGMQSKHCKSSGYNADFEARRGRTEWIYCAKCSSKWHYWWGIYRSGNYGPQLEPCRWRDCEDVSIQSEN